MFRWLCLANTSLTGRYLRSRSGQPSAIILIEIVELRAWSVELFPLPGRGKHVGVPKGQSAFVPHCCFQGWRRLIAGQGRLVPGAQDLCQSHARWSAVCATPPKL